MDAASLRVSVATQPGILSRIIVDPTLVAPRNPEVAQNQPQRHRQQHQPFHSPARSGHCCVCQISTAIGNDWINANNTRNRPVARQPGASLRAFACLTSLHPLQQRALGRFAAGCVEVIHQHDKTNALTTDREHVSGQCACVA
jgi:hypothetical protein